jgi:TctA family transporter
MLGFLLGYVGIDENNAERFTFGLTYLKDGISIVILTSGIFAVPEIIDMLRGKSKLQALNSSWRQVMLGMAAWKKYWKVSIRGGIIGSIVGALPGVPGTVADWLGYIQAKFSYPRKKFGSGVIPGVVGPEGANNAVHAASFVPTVIFGIPGTPFAAIILSIFYMLNFNLGSVELQSDVDFYKYLTVGFLGGTVFVGILCVLMSKPITLLLKIPTIVYAPLILALITWACYQVTHTYYDIVLLVICSAIGLLSKRFELNRPAILLAFILFPRIEALTIQTSSLYNVFSLIERPIFVTFLFLTIALIIVGIRYVKN